jgi:hypothetical protein
MSSVVAGICYSYFMIQDMCLSLWLGFLRIFGEWNNRLSVQKDTSKSRQDDRVVMSDTLVILYLGLVWMDYPVLFSDIRQWVQEGWLPYLGMPESTPHFILKHITTAKRHAISGRVRR